MRKKAIMCVLIATNDSVRFLNFDDTNVNLEARRIVMRVMIVVLLQSENRLNGIETNTRNRPKK